MYGTHNVTVYSLTVHYIKILLLVQLLLVTIMRYIVANTSSVCTVPLL